MKALLAIILLTLGLAALPAVADHERGRAFGYRPDFRVQQPPPGQYRGDRGREYQRERQGSRGQRPQQGRLTDEERRDLRRDLDKANRELYRKPPPRR
jgi:hypothetical protein